MAPNVYVCHDNHSTGVEWKTNRRGESRMAAEPSSLFIALQHCNIGMCLLLRWLQLRIPQRNLAQPTWATLSALKYSAVSTLSAL
jgi:hypothetical protein